MYVLETKEQSVRVKQFFLALKMLLRSSVSLNDGGMIHLQIES